MGISQRQEERSTLEKDWALTMGLPRPNPFSVPKTLDQALSDFLLHAGITAGTVIGVYAYTGLYAGPGHAGIVYQALFSPSTAYVGESALATTRFAMSVYAEPFVVAGRFVAPVVVPLTAAAALHYGVSGLSRSLGLYEMEMGVSVDFNAELRAHASRQ